MVCVLPPEPVAAAPAPVLVVALLPAAEVALSATSGAEGIFPANILGDEACGRLQIASQRAAMAAGSACTAISAALSRAIRGGGVADWGAAAPCASAAACSSHAESSTLSIRSSSGCCRICTDSSSSMREGAASNVSCPEEVVTEVRARRCTLTGSCRPELTRSFNSLVNVASHYLTRIKREAAN